MSPVSLSSWTDRRSSLTASGTSWNGTSATPLSRGLTFWNSSETKSFQALHKATERSGSRIQPMPRPPVG